MHALVPAMFSTQETKSWDVPDLTLLGHVCYGSKSGFATLLVSKTVLHNRGIMCARREMYSDSLRDHSGSGCVRSRFESGHGIV